MVPEGWKEETLQEITKEKISYGIVQAGPHVDDGVPYIKSSDVGGDIDVNRLQKTAVEIHQKYRRSAVHPDDIVFSLRGNIARTSIVPAELAEANLTQGTARISVNALNDTKFVYYKLASSPILNRINALSKGSTFKEISLEELRKVKLPLPPLPEQRKIAKILATWDKAIATTEKLIAASQQQKKALMQQLLSGKKRLTSPETGQPFEGEWENTLVSTTAKCFSGGTPSRTNDEYYGGTIPWITSGKLNDRFVESVNEYITESGVSNSSAKYVAQGALLIAMYGATAGKVAINRMQSATINQAVLALEVKEAHSNLFLFYLLEKEMEKALTLVQGGQPNLNAAIIKGIKIKLPRLDEQQKIAAVLTAADKEIEVQQAKLAHLKQEKKALMQQLLTGKRRVTIDEMEISS
ncbi:restriction endonuclease subunit S [Neiella sp. HB171785]|uniref:Restriction endonuclease subunit S n=1 Tax=Neiella litorisoli TaxID=2771431 RepID=A0A8J6QJJ4_9GAMM|nr:restriction endonuclease subunit S [Neiella litorisoli]MBD1389261.1 restriction endonuclease subunit S [Neiella litorisoli]